MLVFISYCVTAGSTAIKEAFESSLVSLVTAGTNTIKLETRTAF